MEAIIEAIGLSKSYDSNTVLSGASLSVGSGETCYLLGEPSSGKTTFLSILTALIKPDAGRAAIDGHTLGEADNQLRRAVGLVFPKGMLDGTLTVRENILSRGALYGVRRKTLRDAFAKATAVLGIEDVTRKRYGKLSPLEGRLADLARAVVHHPAVLLLDEPVASLEPEDQEAFWTALFKLKEAFGLTILAASRDASEAWRFDKVAVMAAGMIVASGAPAELMAAFGGAELDLTVSDLIRTRRVLDDLGYRHREKGRVISISLDSSVESILVLENCKPFVDGVQVRGGTLADALAKIMESGEVA
jgi:multidrug/hemolysin transport system ATP-binding protein